MPFGFLTATTPLLVLIPLLCLRRLPFSFASVAAQTIIYGPLESEKQGAASSAYNTIRQVAASFGVALIATVQLSQFHSHVDSAVAAQGLSAPTAEITRAASQAGYQDAFFICAAIMVIPIVVSFFVSSARAAETFRSRMAQHAELPVEAELPPIAPHEREPLPHAGGR